LDSSCPSDTPFEHDLADKEDRAHRLERSHIVGRVAINHDHVKAGEEIEP